MYVHAHSIPTTRYTPRFNRNVFYDLTIWYVTPTYSKDKKKTTGNERNAHPLRKKMPTTFFSLSKCLLYDEAGYYCTHHK